MATLMSLQNLKETRSFSLICAHCESCIEFGLKDFSFVSPKGLPYRPGTTTSFSDFFLIFISFLVDCGVVMR